MPAKYKSPKDSISTTKPHKFSTSTIQRRRRSVGDSNGFHSTHVVAQTSSSPPNPKPYSRKRRSEPSIAPSRTYISTPRSDGSRAGWPEYVIQLPPRDGAEGKVFFRIDDAAGNADRSLVSATEQIRRDQKVDRWLRKIGTYLGQRRYMTESDLENPSGAFIVSINLLAFHLLKLFFFSVPRIHPQVVPIRLWTV